MDITKLDKLYSELLTFFQGNSGQIQHFAKVHSFAALIGRQEGLSEKEQFTLEAAALTHDVGIRPAMEKFGRCNGKLQEQEGPPVVQEMLAALDFPRDVTERVAYLVGHHHTYTDIDGIDYQILVEADFLVNLFEGGSSKEQIQITEENIFRTKSGKEILRRMFLPETL